MQWRKIKLQALGLSKIYEVGVKISSKNYSKNPICKIKQKIWVMEKNNPYEKKMENEDIANLIIKKMKIIFACWT
jgi:hypothetical protein